MLQSKLLLILLLSSVYLVSKGVRVIKDGRSFDVGECQCLDYVRNECSDLGPQFNGAEDFTTLECPTFKCCVPPMKFYFYPVRDNSVYRIFGRR